ncbi:alpha-L-fucosidase [Arachnia propionica]|uniref:alpha-L-fucosidase n=1 Tax=Arachnia propionica TaxID=1750 RepID=A0A3P1WUE1_9ACTN|nr:alpha-L-fucosidase [Arachnia propionica]RRD49855.1 alpha-L-fucosidase [Arachnia propionica]
MLYFDERTGPDLGVTYPDVTPPTWYRDAKLGVFIHWGLFSIPAWAETHDGRVPVEDAFTRHRYAEWYGNTVRIQESSARAHHLARFGEGTTYEDLADHWQLPSFRAPELIASVLRSGARYVIPVTKHHDGFCLWDTSTTGFNAVRRGPGRDLIQELADATRAAGARFGVYFSGALDWHVSDLPPIRSERDLFVLRRNDPSFARYAAAQLGELIERFSPDVLWNDIEWPDSGKGGDDFGVAALWRRYLTAVPHGVVNDRWGVPAHGHLTREYLDVAEIQDQVWESTRGLGQSFGYNAAEDESHSLSAPDLIRHLVDVVAKNGNLLINVGPRADGSVPDVQQRALDGLGQWLVVNGQAVFGSRPWLRAGEGTVRHTVVDGQVFAHVLDPQQGRLRLPPELCGTTSVNWLGGDEAPVHDGEAEIPEPLRNTAVAVARIG